MNKPFGVTSKARLAQSHPDLQRLFIKVNGLWQCTILSGGRTIKEQADFVNGTNLTGINPEKRVLSKTMLSKHLIQPDGYCHALDVAPDPVNFEKPNYNLDLIYFSGFVMGIAHEMGIPIRYGGDWGEDHMISNESFVDTDHFEIDDR